MPCKRKSTVKNESTSAQKYSGVAIDIANDNQVSRKLEKERTATLNNNPRNEDD